MAASLAGYLPASRKVSISPAGSSRRSTFPFGSFVHGGPLRDVGVGVDVVDHSALPR